jgi:hypothetical protein
MRAQKYTNVNNRVHGINQELGGHENAFNEIERRDNVIGLGAYNSGPSTLSGDNITEILRMQWAQGRQSSQDLETQQDSEPNEGSCITTPLCHWTDELPHGGTVIGAIPTLHAPRFQGPLYHGEESYSLRETIEHYKTRLNAVDDLIGFVIKVSLPANSAPGQRVLRNFVIVGRGREKEDFFAWYEARFYLAPSERG